MWNHKGSWIAKEILRKNKAGAINLCDFKLYALVEIVWHWHRSRWMDQCSRIKSPQLSRVYMVSWHLTREWRALSEEKAVSLINSGGFVTKLWPTLVIPWTVACQTPLSMGFSRQEYWSVLPFPWWWDNWIVICKGMKTDPELIPLTEINKKWIKALNVQCGIKKFLEGNTAINLPDPEIKPRSTALQADTLLSEPPGKPTSASHLLDPQKILVFIELCASKQTS